MPTRIRTALSFVQLTLKHTIFSTDDPFTCYVQVQLPLEEIVCAVLSTVTGTLHAVPSVLAGVVDSALGLVANIDIGPWSCLA